MQLSGYVIELHGFKVGGDPPLQIGTSGGQHEAALSCLAASASASTAAAPSGLLAAASAQPAQPAPSLEQVFRSAHPDFGGSTMAPQLSLPQLPAAPQHLLAAPLQLAAQQPLPLMDATPPQLRLQVSRSAPPATWQLRLPQGRDVLPQLLPSVYSAAHDAMLPEELLPSRNKAPLRLDLADLVDDNEGAFCSLLRSPLACRKREQRGTPHSTAPSGSEVMDVLGSILAVRSPGFGRTPPA